MSRKHEAGFICFGSASPLEAFETWRTRALRTLCPERLLALAPWVLKQLKHREGSHENGLKRG